MNRAKRDFIETIIVTSIVMAYVLLIFWIRRARVAVAPLVVFSIVTIAIGITAIFVSNRKKR